MKNVFATIIGFIIASATVYIFESIIGHNLFPLPEGADPMDMEWIKNNMDLVPIGAKIFVVIAHFVGIIVGMIMAAKISKQSMVPSYIVGVLMLVATYATIFMLPKEIWFTTADSVMVIIGFFIGKIYAQKTDVNKLIMLKKLSALGILFVLFTFQSNAQHLDHLKAINTVWSKFYSAFETLDYTLMADIHAKDLVRVSGGQNILDYDTYINSYKSRFQRDKDANVTSHIALRFFERINTDFTASERGIYKLTINKDTKTEQIYYGQFHVIFRKTNGVWKIIMDYDSTESDTIGEDDYNKAYSIDDFDKFVRK